MKIWCIIKIDGNTGLESLAKIIPYTNKDSAEQDAQAITNTTMTKDTYYAKPFLAAEEKC